MVLVTSALAARKGQALERVLLTACQAGLQASFLNQPVQVASLRPKLRDVAGRGAAFADSGRVLAAVAVREGWQVLDEKPSLLNDALIAASCREQGITLITKDGDFKRLASFVKGFRYAAPWPVEADEAQ